MSSQEHAAPMRLERTREAFDLIEGMLRFPEDREAGGELMAAALAELEQAEAALDALAKIAYGRPANNAQGNLNIARDTAARALAAFGSGEGTG